MTLAEGLPFAAALMSLVAVLVSALSLKALLKSASEMGRFAHVIGDELGDHDARLEALEPEHTTSGPAWTTDDEAFELFPTAAPIGGTNYPWDN
jgi:hypothetical protein